MPVRARLVCILGGCPQRSCEAPAAMQLVTRGIAIWGMKRHLLALQRWSEREAGMSNTRHK